MFKNSSVLFFMLTILLTLNACKLDASGDCYFEAPAYPTAVDGPSTGTLNQPINLNMTFQLANGCGSYLRTETYTDADTTEVIIRARYQGCVCTQQLITTQQTYTYTPSRTGAHYFRYYISDGNYLRDTIWVQ